MTTLTKELLDCAYSACPERRELFELTERVVPGYWEDRGYDVDAWIGMSNGRDDAGA